MDGDGNNKDDVKVPETDLGKEIETAFEEGKDCMVTIIAAMGALILSPLLCQPLDSSADLGNRRGAGHLLEGGSSGRLSVS